MTKRVRVLHAIQNLNYGGMERVLSDIALRCDHQQFETHVLCLQYLGRFAKGLEDVATLHVAAPMSAGSMIWPRSLASQMRSIRPDVLHSHSGVWYKASYAARLANVPRIVHTEHGRAKPDPIQSRLVDRIGAARSDVVVAVSAALAEQLRSDLGVPERKLAVVPNGVDTETYCQRPDTGRLRRELGIARETPIIGSIGRLEPIKGYDVMIDAFARLHSRGKHNGAVLVIAGEGTDRPRLEQMVAAYNLGKSIFLPGWRDDVHDMQSAFTFFTMSSRSEGTSISLLEAMSTGLAPVVTDVGGNAAVLGDELQHCLVPSEDAEALSLAWEEMLQDPRLRERGGVTARSRVREAFGLDAMVRAYERLYLGATPELPERPQASGVRGVPPSPRNSAECPPVM
jgi:glycosyltransferase involved in cell wall biosynthesis